MNRTSKIFLFTGVAVQAASAALFFALVRPLTDLALICLCFIVFAELEFFGGMAAMIQYAHDRLSPAARVGFGIVSGAYTCFAIVLSLTFLPLGGGMVKAFFVLELLLLAAMLFLDLLLALFVKRRIARQNTQTS